MARFVALAICSAIGWFGWAACHADEKNPRPSIRWQHLSSRNGDLPAPGPGKEQTACLVLDMNRDGRADFVIAERTASPSVTGWLSVGKSGWTKLVIDAERLNIEAGGETADIDGDGDLDIIFTGDYKSDGVWWWENPSPNFDPNTPWRRRTIKSGDGASSQHDSCVGDFDGDGRLDLVWWSKAVRSLFCAPFPDRPREAASWPYRVIFRWDAGKPHEGLCTADIDGDGLTDIVGAGMWWKYRSHGRFEPEVIAPRPFVRVAARQIIAGGRCEVVISPGDEDGPIDWYQWDGRSWVGRRLLDRVIHGHSLQLADIDGDGALDIFSGEMGNPGAGPNCKTRIFWGDGQGGFAEQVIDVGKAHHESRLADFDGDGLLDILGKPYSFETPIVHLWLQRRQQR